MPESLGITSAYIDSIDTTERENLFRFTLVPWGYGRRAIAGTINSSALTVRRQVDVRPAQSRQVDELVLFTVAPKKGSVSLFKYTRWYA
jgi:hypothetical protein